MDFLNILNCADIDHLSRTGGCDSPLSSVRSLSSLPILFVRDKWLMVGLLPVKLSTSPSTSPSSSTVNPLHSHPRHRWSLVILIFHEQGRNSLTNLEDAFLLGSSDEIRLRRRYGWLSFTRYDTEQMPSAHGGGMDNGACCSSTSVRTLDSLWIVLPRLPRNLNTIWVTEPWWFEVIIRERRNAEFNTAVICAPLWMRCVLYVTSFVVSFGSSSRSQRLSQDTRLLRTFW